MHGFWNRLLRVDLSTQRTRIEHLPDEVLKVSLGGKGLGSYLLLTEAGNTDPLSEVSPLIFTCGPLTATAMPGASRYGVYARSPLTGGYAESYSGGHLAPPMKRSGYDAVIIKGRAPSPVYLHISDRGVEFRPGQHLWGKDTYETEETILAEVNRPGAQAAVIGPAGERLVPFACIANNKWRQAGRAGMGAVMGSKRLKGIAFSGDGECPLADAAALKQMAAALTLQGNKDRAVANYRRDGTTFMVATTNMAGSFPSRYWHAGTMEGWQKLSADHLHRDFDVKPKACHRCFIACGKQTTVRTGKYAGLSVEGPEYETIYAFGGLCLIPDLAEVLHLNDLCDRLGMDTISTGNLVALAMEAHERELLTGPAYGDARGAAELVSQIAFRQGLGGVLAQGIIPASKKLGLESIAMHVKGLEPAGYDPRVFKGMGLAYAVATRGACHLRSTFYRYELTGISDPDVIQGKAAMLVNVENRLTIMDSLIMCRFFRDLMTWERLSAVIEAATGFKLSTEQLSQIGNHTTSLARAYNYRLGFTAADDRLPARFHDEPLDGKVITRQDLATMLHDYYQARGWDEKGTPPDLQVG